MDVCRFGMLCFGVSRVAWRWLRLRIWLLFLIFVRWRVISRRICRVRMGLVLSWSAIGVRRSRLCRLVR